MKLDSAPNPTPPPPPVEIFLYSVKNNLDSFLMVKLNCINQKAFLIN